MAEYRAVRTAAGLLDRSARGRIGVSGRDRAAFLQGVLTNDIDSLEPGSGCYAAYLTPQGRMIADMRVLNFGDLLILDVRGELKDELLAKFDKLIFTEDISFADLTSEWTAIGVHGPSSAGVVVRALASADVGGELPPAEELTSLSLHASIRIGSGSGSIFIVRADETGEPGFDLLAPRSVHERLHGALAAAGAIDVNEEAAEMLRIESGRPEFHVDMDEDTIPLEAGIEDRAISFTKGCYVGQEVIIRVLHRGHGRVARKLVGLTFTRVEPPADIAARAGEQIYVGAQSIGRLTSVAWSPALDRTIALGYVRREHSDAGTEVEIGERRHAAVVTTRPFVQS